MARVEIWREDKIFQIQREVSLSDVYNLCVFRLRTQESGCKGEMPTAK